MKMQELAVQFRKIASDKAYRDLMELNNLAQGLPIDIYGEKDEMVVAGLKDVARWMAQLADKAYRQGLSAPDFAYLLDKAKTKATLLKSLDLDSASRSELDKFYNKLLSVSPADIQPRVPAQVGSAFKATSDIKGQVGESKEENEGALNSVVQDLARKQYPSEKDNLGSDGKLIAPPARQVPGNSLRMPTDEEASDVVRNLGKDWKSYDFDLGPDGKLINPSG